MDHWIVVLGSAGIGQVLLLLLILYTEDSSRSPASLWLGLFLFSVGATLAADIIASLGLSLVFVYVTPLLTAALLLIGPTLWLYARSLTERDNILTPNLIWHFLPFVILAVALYSQLFRITMAELGAAADPELAQNRSKNELIWLTPIAAQIAAYLVAVLGRVRQSHVRLTSHFSNIEHRTLHWITLLCALVGSVLLAWVLSWGISHRASNLITTVGYLLAIALIGDRGIRQANLFQKRPKPTLIIPSMINEVESSEDDGHSSSACSRSLEVIKYSRAPLPTARAQQLQIRLEERMQMEKPYLDEDLTLPELATQIGTSAHQLSQLFNQQLGESFYDYVNRHRVAAFQRTAALPMNRKRPLLAIALECGFGSKSTFNAVFKRQVGMSPSTWRQKTLPAVSSVQQCRHQPPG